MFDGWPPLLFAAAALTACTTTPAAQTGPTRPQAKPAFPQTSETAPPPRTARDACYAAFEASASETAEARDVLTRLTDACGPQGGMRPITQVRESSQSSQDPVDRFSFVVPKAGNCYRIFAAGGQGVQDLDVLLRDPEGNQLAGDLSDDPWPIVPARSAVCFDAPGLYVLEVSVYRGAGKYAIQVWGT